MRRAVARIRVADDTGTIILGGIRPSWAPLAKQAVIVGLVAAAAVASILAPSLLVTDTTAVWISVGCVLLGLVFAALIARYTVLLPAELLIPALGFVAVGLLRYGTGGSRSVFLVIIVLPIIWIAAKPGRQHITYPLLGTAVTLLLPYAIAPMVPQTSEIVRLIVAVLVYAAAASVTNELSRQANLRLRISDRHRRVAETEIVHAAMIQQSLLPAAAADLPPDVHAVGLCAPARVVGGDFYDWFSTTTGAAFTLGDVMGKGVGAGMIAAAVRSLIRSTGEDNVDAATALRRAAAGLTTGDSDLTSGQFTTCFHIRIAHDGTAEWADAGHGLNLIRRADGDHEPLRSPDLPIGVGANWVNATTVLAPGDSVITISDGVLDLFGTDANTLDRFEAFARQHPVADMLVDAIRKLAAGTDHPDDVTVLVITYRGNHHRSR